MKEIFLRKYIHLKDFAHINTIVVDSLLSHSLPEEKEAHVGPNDELSPWFTKYGLPSICITRALVIKVNSCALSLDLLNQKFWVEA